MGITGEVIKDSSGKEKMWQGNANYPQKARRQYSGKTIQCFLLGPRKMKGLKM